MILGPTNDEACLGQLTRIVRELVPTTLIRTVAARLGTPEAVVEWLQSLPQTNDDGAEIYRAITCDVPQRVRLLPDDPNCFERAMAALALLEVLDPRTMRKLVTADQPARHTGVVELRRKEKRWVALDLFPRRNFNWGRLGGDVLRGIQGAHHYVGKPVLQLYGLGGVSDLAEVAIAQGAGGKTEKKDVPPIRPIAASGIGQLAQVAVGAIAGGGGKSAQPEPKKGGGNGSQETAQRIGQAIVAGAGAAATARNRGPLGEEAAPAPERERFWGAE